MPNANARQHGGDHYRSDGYQHWDWVNDCRLSYIVGVASKYAFRWRKKDGKLDLEKGVHYLDKAIEVGAQGSIVGKRYDHFWKFVVDNNVRLDDAMVLFMIMEGQFADAREALAAVLAAAPSED